MKTPNIRFPLSAITDFRREWMDTSHLRYGQFFYNFFNLHTYHQDREWLDVLYNADQDTAERMINSVTDWEN